MKIIKYTLLIFSIFLFGCNPEKPKIETSKNVLVDDLGNEFDLREIPKKVVTLAPNLTEMIYALNQEDRLIGNTLYCNFPPEANNITKVGDMLTLNYEIILSLKPDLVFITIEGNTKETYNRLKDLGIQVFVSNPRNYSDIKKTFKQFAQIFDVTNFADSLINNWDFELNEIKKDSSSNKKTLLFLAAITPIMAAGQNTFINEYINLCGLENVVHDSTINYPVFSREEILKINPDFIVYAAMEKLSNQYLTDVYSEWKNLKAVKNDKIIFVDPDLFYRPGPRFVEAVKTLYEEIHKE